MIQIANLLACSREIARSNLQTIIEEKGGIRMNAFYRIFVLILCMSFLAAASTLGQTSQAHSQPEPIPAVDPPPEAPAFGWNWEASQYMWNGTTFWTSGSKRELGLNIFHNPVAVSNNYLLRVDDQVCLGDDIQVFNTETTGEWFSKGGPQDSPPILFVDDINAARQSIYSGDISFVGETYYGSVCAGKRRVYADKDEADFKGTWAQNCAFDGQVICEKSCTELSADGSSIPTSAVTVLADGSYTFDCQTSCFLFIHKVADPEVLLSGEKKPIAHIDDQPDESDNLETFLEWSAPVLQKYISLEVNSILDLSGSGGSVPLSFDSEIAFAGVVATTGPTLTIEENGYNAELGILYATVTNEGGIGAIVDSVNLPSNPGAEVLYAPASLGAGESDDILISLSDTGTAHLDVAYRAEALGCQDTKEYANTYGFNLANAENPYTAEVIVAGYDLILRKGVEPEPNLLDLRSVLGTQ